MSTLDHLLAGSSRTFALSIPFLDEPVRAEVATAYLLFRIADTIEDEPGWTDESRLEALESMRAAMVSGAVTDEPIEQWLRQPAARLDHEGYARLFDEAGLVCAVLGGLDQEASRQIAQHLTRTLDGMIEFVRNGRRTTDLDTMLEYCYSVAGIVGELCTTLFARSCPSLRVAGPELMVASARYGEGLQLVNILRDSRADEDASRRFLPEGVSTPQLIELARADLNEADRYVQMLERHGAPAGVVAFNMLNVRLAHDTLSLIIEHGAGVKIRRAQVRSIVDRVLAESGASSPF